MSLSRRLVRPGRLGSLDVLGHRSALELFEQIAIRRLSDLGAR
jgi:hypothetical protein